MKELINQVAEWFGAAILRDGFFLGGANPRQMGRFHAALCRPVRRLAAWAAGL